MRLPAGTMIIFALLLAWAGQARADSWIPPSVTSYFSKDKSHRLTVHPRPFTNALDFFTDKVCGRELAGAPAKTRQRTARAVLERSDGRGGWTSVWAMPLRNEVAPVEAIVSNDGRYAVTFDNWHSMGFGDDVVVIYDAGGHVVGSFSLTDFLPEDFVSALPRSVSSIHWRGDPRFSGDGKSLIIPVVIPSQRERGERELIHISIELATGRPSPPSGSKWQEALSAAMEVGAARITAEREARARFEAPLLGPQSGGEREWHEYLREAFYRTAPDWREGSTSTTVLRAQTARDYEKSVTWVSEALGPTFHGDDDRSFASPSQENLAEVFEAAAARIRPGALKGVNIYVAITDAHRGRFERALAHSGARFIQLDPTRPIPQRPERLAARNAPPPVEEKLCAQSAGG